MPASVVDRSTSKILIVDDDEAVTTTFSRILKLEGYQVRAAGNAQKGLEEAEQGNPDAIILDLRMPLVDGLGFLRQLRTFEYLRTTPVAIVTGDYFIEDAVSSELRELGAKILYKPMFLEDIVALARQLLQVSN